MNDYRVVDMSNSKYIIKGITLGNKVNSYFYMDKGTLINKIIITDKDMSSINSSELVFCIKGLDNNYLEHMINSFCSVLANLNITCPNYFMDIKDINTYNNLREILVKLGKLTTKDEVKEKVEKEIKIEEIRETKREEVPDILNKEEFKKQEINNLKEENKTLEKKKDDFENFLGKPSENPLEKKETRVIEEAKTFQREIPKGGIRERELKKKQTIKYDETAMDMDMFDDNDRYLINNDKDGKSKVVIVLLVLSILLIIGSVIMFILR